MRKCRFASCRLLGLGFLLGAFAALPVQAASADGAPCSDPQFTQPFLSVGDDGLYTLAPGQSVDNFDATGWTLSDGARLTTTTLSDGNTGTVLDLPGGSQAVSPVMCVQAGYGRMRTMVRDVVGGGGVAFYASYAGTKSENKPKNSGQFHGSGADWTVSRKVTTHVSNADGWQLVRFTFVAGGASSEFQLYNVYVDPRMRS